MAPPRQLTESMATAIAGTSSPRPTSVKGEGETPARGRSRTRLHEPDCEEGDSSRGNHDHRSNDVLPDPWNEDQRDTPKPMWTLSVGTQPAHAVEHAEEANSFPRTRVTMLNRYRLRYPSRTWLS